jgi:hypothetical protein
VRDGGELQALSFIFAQRRVTPGKYAFKNPLHKHGILRKLFKMSYCIKLVLTIFTAGLIACGQSTKSPFDKLPIDLDSVDFVMLEKHQRNDTIVPEPISLTDSQAKLIADKWNNSVGKGLCKYLPEFFMTVYLKDKRKREFRINGQNIKENNDWCYDLGEPDFIEKLLNGAE